MAKNKNIVRDAGFGTSFENIPKRMINTDGSFNVKRIVSHHYLNDLYKYLTDISWLKFFLVLFSIYISFNLLFSTIYYIIGVDGLKGIEYTYNEFNIFLQVFYFSCQTFTTVGYGGVIPISNSISFISSVEAFIGLLSFAIATGLLYGRFSKPNSKISYSNNILLSPYQEKKALMFKIVNKRENVLMNVNISMMASIRKKMPNGDVKTTYQNLELESNEVTFFPLTWTIVHPISENSLFSTWSEKDYKENDVEFFIFIKAYDDTFNQDVISYHSYINKDVILNKKFIRNFTVDSDGDFILNVEDIHKFE